MSEQEKKTLNPGSGSLSDKSHVKYRVELHQSQLCRNQAYPEEVYTGLLIFPAEFAGCGVNTGIEA